MPARSARPASSTPVVIDGPHRGSLGVPAPARRDSLRGRWQRGTRRRSEVELRDAQTKPLDAPEGWSDLVRRGRLSIVAVDPATSFANRIWIQPGAQEIPVQLGDDPLVVQMSPAELPDEGLIISVELRRGGRQLAGCRLKGDGAPREVALSLEVPLSCRSHRATLCVRSNAELHIQF